MERGGAVYLSSEVLLNALCERLVRQCVRAFGLEHLLQEVQNSNLPVGVRGLDKHFNREVLSRNLALLLLEGGAKSRLQLLECLLAELVVAAQRVVYLFALRPPGLHKEERKSSSKRNVRLAVSQWLVASINSG